MDNKKIYQGLGVVATILMIIAAVYITAKNHKKEGFWFGVLALALVGSYIYVGSGKDSTQDVTKLRFGHPGPNSKDPDTEV